MTRMLFGAVGAAAIIASAASAQPPANLATGELQWKEMFPGVEFAPAYGDWEKGDHGKYVRFAPGTKVPMHKHTNPYHGVMLSGRMTNLYDDGSKRVEVAPGDYFMIAAKRTHGHECLAANGCLFYTYGTDLWDLELVEED